MIAAIAIAQPAVPSKVNRNNSQAEHHPAKNCAHQSAILKHWMAHQLRMGAHRIDQRAHADADGSASGKQHAHRENLARPTMHQSAFFSHNRSPKGNQANGTGDNVGGDEEVEEIKNRH